MVNQNFADDTALCCVRDGWNDVKQAVTKDTEIHIIQLLIC